MEQETLQKIEAGLPAIGNENSMSPPRFRPHPNWRANTPPPLGKSAVTAAAAAAASPAAVTATATSNTPIPRNKSSPSFVDMSSPNKEYPTTDSPHTLSPTQQRRIHCHSELTPVTRNTSFCEQEPYYVVISPEDYHADDHLTMPSDLYPSTTRNFTDNTIIRNPWPLQHHLRAQSVGNLKSGTQLPKTATKHPTENTINEEELKRSVPLLPQKFYSFNSRHQYQEQTKLHQQPLLTPYQPNSRETVGVAPDDAGNIFLPRPLVERQWSIPSIRLANHLTGGSTTTLDEEDTLEDVDGWCPQQQYALEWLQDLQHDGLHEAASSRFLNGGPSVAPS